MKIIIISEGKHGNGRKVAEDVMGAIKEKGKEAHIYSVEDVKPKKIEKGGFYIFVSPTHTRGPGRKMKKAVKKGIFPDSAPYGLITISKKQKGKTTEKMEKYLKKKGFSKEMSNLHLLENKNGELKGDYTKKIQKFCSNLPDF